jgi:hypothetical protein
MELFRHRTKQNQHRIYATGADSNSQSTVMGICNESIVMKLNVKKNPAAGSVLLVTLATCVILGVLMGSLFIDD